MNRQLRASITVITSLSLGILLSSCAATAAKVDMSTMDHSMLHTMPITDRQSFALAMIPHHQQAVVMSNLALANTQNPAVLALAELIISAQSTEILKMDAWLDGKSVDSTMMMDGMLSEMELASLKAAKDDAFDKLYSQYMIMHHEGAIAMATQVLSLDDMELSDFGAAIIKQQSTEIKEFEAIANQ